MKLSSKLISAFLGVSLIAVFVGLIGFYGFLRSSDAVEILTRSDIKILELSGEVRVAMLDCRRFEKNSFIRASIKKDHAQALANFGKSFQALKESTTLLQNSLAKTEGVTPTILNKSKELTPFIEKYEEIFRKVTARVEADPVNMNATNADMAMAEAINAIRCFESNLKDIQKAVQEMVEETGQQTLSDNTKYTYLMLVMSGAGFIGALALGVSISNSVSKSLTHIAEQIAAGSEQTLSASTLVSSASQSLAEGASEQAASLQETSASLEEITSMTRRNADSASHARSLAGEARAAAEKGAADVNEMGAAMGEIKLAGDGVAKILKAIDEIAFQTNILALNAAVEAARAGEAGAGFAVVADEVRNLAQRCAEAAKETAQKIDESNLKSTRGIEISSRVSSSLANILEKNRQVDILIGEIASASQEPCSFHKINLFLKKPLVFGIFLLTYYR